jgi:hypothetical protein
MDLEICVSIGHGLVDDILMILIILLKNYSLWVNEISQWISLPKKRTSLYHIILFPQLLAMKAGVAATPDESE